MKIVRTGRFSKDYRALPEDLRERVKTALRRLIEDPRHPSLHTKRMKGTKQIYEIRVSKGYRITFQWQEGVIILRRVGTHDVLKKP